MIENDSDFLWYHTVKNVNRVTIRNLNISSVSSTFDHLKPFAQGKVNFITVTETKLDLTFNTEGCSELYRFDKNRNKTGVLIYIWEDISSKLLSDHKLLHDTEETFVELNLRKKNCLLSGSYHPPSQSDDYSFIKLK